MDVDFWSFPEKRGPTPAKLRTREKVGGFFSPEAGQARRQWLNSIDDRIAEGLRYYLGPSGVDQKVTAAAQGGQMLMDGADFQDAYTAGGDLMQSRSIPEAAANFLEFAAPAAAVMIPGVSNRMLQGAGDMAEDAARFVVDESGALRITPRGDYVGSHTAPAREVGATMDNPADIWGDDIYGRNALQYFGTGDAKIDRESLAAIQKMRKSPTKETTVYRAVPRDAPDDINAGDWVTTSRKYAEGHGDSALDGDYKIVAEKVRAGELATDGNSLHEWGWWPDEARIAASAPPSPAQQVADLLASGRAADVTDEMLAKLTPNDNAELFKLYQSGATGADMPMDAASRMARAEGMGFGAGTPLYHGGRSDITGVSKFEGTSEAGQGALFSTSSPRVANTYASPMSRNDVVGNNVTPLFARSGDYKEAGFTVPFPENGSQADMDNWLSRVDAFNRRLDPDGAKQAYFERQASAARSDGRPGAVIREVEDNRRAVGFVEPSDVYMTLDPTTIRSRFARFDPRLSHLANLSAAGAGVAVINGQDDLTPEEQFRRMWWAQQPQKGNSQ
jgi:hypothetical protein